MSDITNQSVWPKEWHGMSHEERRDDLLKRMFAMPPAQHKQLVGKSVRLPRKPKRIRERDKPKGFYNVLPEGNLLAKINAVVPKKMRPEWRDELVQDIAVAILSGEAEESILTDMKAIGKMRNKVIAMYPDRWRYVEVNDPDTSDEALIDFLSDGESHDLAEIQKLWQAKKGG